MYQDTLNLTQLLVRLSSTSGHETEALAFTASWLRDHDFSDVALTADFAAGRIAGSADAKRSLIFCGHIDTVVTGDLSGWTVTAPTEPLEQDGKLYGLGTTDMKAGLALHMVLAAAQAGKQLPYDIWIAAVANEETDGTGAQAFVEWFTQHTAYERSYCMIAEPTDMTRVEIGHRGSAFIELTCKGKPGHASNPDSYPVSGLGLAHKLLDSLPQIRDSVKSYADPMLGQPSVVPTVLQAGDPSSPNKTSDTATVVLDVRTTPQLDVNLADWISGVAKQHHASWRYAAAPTPASLCASDSPIVTAMLQASGTSEPAISLGATDQFSFQNAGIDTVVFGPGTFAAAHTQNEYIELAAIEKALEVYDKALGLLK